MPHLTFGVEYRIKNKWCVELGYGKRIFDQGIYHAINYKLSGHNSNQVHFDSIITPSYGARIYIELKYLLPNQMKNFYTGIGYYNIIDTRNIAITYFIPDSIDASSRHGATEHTAIKKELNVFNLLCGYVYKVNRFQLDTQIMLGLKHKKQEYIKNEFDEMGYDSFHHYSWDSPMNTFRPSINISFKIGYRISN
jgi:hypothetical protein